MKKLIAVLLVLTLVLSLAACAPKPAEPAATTNVEQGNPKVGVTTSSMTISCPL